MLKIGQNWGKIANYSPQCSTKIGTPVHSITWDVLKRDGRLALLIALVKLELCSNFWSNFCSKCLVSYGARWGRLDYFCCSFAVEKPRTLTNLKMVCY